ncbi:MAG: patatin-like phospholipase family protein, partial [Hyphomicrobiaceae bacterium]
MPKRSLILAGGGLKVAYQAGVLQVWLDEAGLTFDHADGTSGGVFNLAMYCQGSSGRQIADNWRNFPVLSSIGLNWRQYLRLYWSESLLTYDEFRSKVLRGLWKLDWDKIRKSDRLGTFNTYNFSKNEHRVLTHDRMDEDTLVACVTLPMWFQPVTIDGDRYIDAVYLTDANLDEAIRRGADELWIVWTVSRKAEWKGGFVATYFQIIETTANGHLRRDLARVEANNAAIDRGERGEFGRKIKVEMLAAEVPLHYLVNFKSSDFTAAVEQGIADARTWCRQRNISLKSGDALVGLTFDETMRGPFAMGVTDPQEGERIGKAAGTELVMKATVTIPEFDRFLNEPNHTGRLKGTIDYTPWAKDIPAPRGVFNLFGPGSTEGLKHFVYELGFEHEGKPYYLAGRKNVENRRNEIDLWTDTT